LQECREELEKARNRIQELDFDVNEMKQKHRAMKKARDELDALREGQDKAARLEMELSRLKAKMEESELVYERVEFLEVENRYRFLRN
jgi:DNA repair exonuclease SbcCD ATPase subunit